MLLPPLALVASALGLFLVLALGLVYASLDEAGRAQFAGLLLPRAALLVLAWMLAVLVATAALIRWWVPCMAALPELAEQTRALANADEPLRLGDTSGQRPPARYIGDGPTLVRLYAGRPVDGVSYELAGAEAAELNIFGR